jgi:hypothetical protein
MRAGWVVAGVAVCALAVAGCGSAAREQAAADADAALRTPVVPAPVSTAPGRCGVVVARTLHEIAARIEARAALHRSIVGRTPALVVSLTRPVHGVCAPTATATVANTVGVVGKRLVRAEQSGREAHQALRVAARYPPFVRAVRRRDPIGLRLAIVHFFHIKPLHIVRVRATTPSGHLIGDVGGPFVLAPVSRTIHSAGGRDLGRVTLSVQDDTGYIKLIRRFTGAGVVLRTAGSVVPGSSAVHGAIPAHGRIAAGGRSFATYTFTTRAFPARSLRVAILVPVTAPAG